MRVMIRFSVVQSDLLTLKVFPCWSIFSRGPKRLAFVLGFFKELMDAIHVAPPTKLWFLICFPDENFHKRLFHSPGFLGAISGFRIHPAHVPQKAPGNWASSLSDPKLQGRGSEDRENLRGAEAFPESSSAIGAGGWLKELEGGFPVERKPVGGFFLGVLPCLRDPCTKWRT